MRPVRRQMNSVKIIVVSKLLEGNERNSGGPCGRPKKGRNHKWTSFPPFLRALALCILRSLLSTHRSVLPSDLMLTIRSTIQQETPLPSRTLPIPLMLPASLLPVLPPSPMLMATTSHIGRPTNSRLIPLHREMSFATLLGHRQ